MADTLQGKRGLVVEDEAMIAMMLEDALETLGCTVACSASRLEEAVELARSAEIDFAVLDLNLDGRLSYPVGDALRERNLPFVLSTGYTSTALPERFRTVPAIGKPLDTAALARALSAALVGPG